MKKSLFTPAERASMREELTFSRPTHGREEYLDFDSREHYGTNANGTKYKK